VLRTERSYDVIISDSTHPGTVDSWVLYTEEFYRLCRARLKQGGLFAQWLPLHGLSVDGYKIILRTFQQVFPHASLWITDEYSVLLGAPDGLRMDIARVERRLVGEAVRSTLSEVDLADATSFLANFALDERSLAAYVGDGPVNTDDRPWISFARYMRTGGSGALPVLTSVLPHYTQRIDISTLTGGSAERERLARRRRSRELAYRGYVLFTMGKPRRAFADLERALTVDPDDREAQRLLQRIQRRLQRRRPD
jgi:hypothetical protein